MDLSDMVLSDMVLSGMILSGMILSFFRPSAKAQDLVMVVREDALQAGSLNC